jgi:secreted Zn-dependent insulinase-like peptidase
LDEIVRDPVNESVVRFPKKNCSSEILHIFVTGIGIGILDFSAHRLKIGLVRKFTSNELMRVFKQNLSKNTKMALFLSWEMLIHLCSARTSESSWEKKIGRAREYFPHIANYT